MQRVVQEGPLLLKVNDMYEKNVFINCPFDEEYKLFQRGIIFTLVALGYNPRISPENSDATNLRLSKIMVLIEESKYSIHDVSRIVSSAEGEYSRMNMPFELGLDFGCKRYSGTESHNSKKSLIIGDKKYEYMKAISDCSGIDIKYHNNDVKRLIESIRNWFVENVEDDPLLTMNPMAIYDSFLTWDGVFYDERKDNGYTDDMIYNTPIKEQIASMKKYFVESRSLKKKKKNK